MWRVIDTWENKNGGPQDLLATTRIPPSSPEEGTQKGGGGAMGQNQKHALGNHFLSQNDNFTTGSTSKLMHWGMVPEYPP